MKGTAPRHPLPAEDRKIVAWLPRDEKNRAENLMITDMVRNDLGRICCPGTVVTEPLFKIDTYNTLHQMISTVRGQVKDKLNLRQLFAAAFPPASITGAPKLSAMQLISELEKSPRKLYTGTVGCFMPDGNLCLNVAIRTLINSDSGCELGVGGGIVYDSKIADEWHEACLKSHFSRAVNNDFKLIETMLYRDGELLWLSEHLKRLASSQNYFKRPWRRDAVMRQISLSIKNIQTPSRVRLLLDRNGELEITVTPLEYSGWGTGPHRIKVSALTTTSNNLFLYHKTTRRQFYNRQFTLAREQGFTEVLFCNELGHLTEGAISSVFIQLDGKWLTPALQSGLLPGIWRQQMIKDLNATETVIPKTDLKRAEKIMLGNSLREEFIASDCCFE